MAFLGHPVVTINRPSSPTSPFVFRVFIFLCPSQNHKTEKKMSTFSHLFDLPEQLCYVQCGFCTTILLVSVPCSSLSTVVTVRCGHCTSLLSVNMMKASFIPLHLLAAINNDEEKLLAEEDETKNTAVDRHSPSLVTNYSDNEEEDMLCVNHVVNKPPEKRQRAPSAYNQFIKEEIRRLKAENPNILHKEAFSTAAKNWAHFPLMHYQADGESCGQEGGAASWSLDAADEVHEEGDGFRERKVPRNSMLAKTLKQTPSE